jgi:uracil phosphoribosyltransferase
MLPSQVCFEAFCELVNPDGVRQDHFFSQRVTVNGRVTGADLRGSKVGGRYDGRIVVVPDPMAATGSSLATVLDYIDGLKRGRPRKVIAAHLIVTPEYIRRVRQAHPGVEIYAIRLDRGLSSKNVLKSVAGARWAEERGLNQHQYIVPGAGGFGELLSNAQE